MHHVRRFALASALLLAGPVLAQDEGVRPPPAAPDVVALRFAWPASARARVSYRRTRNRTGERPKVFTARYETRAERGDGGLRIATRGTSWRGDLPFPQALALDAIRASEQVIQRVGPEGEFTGLEGAEKLRPVLAQVFEEAKVPPEQARQGVAGAEAAMRSEAEELWNLAVGFWTGADLALGETYELESDAEIPLLAGVRARHAIEFSVRRRVPCAVGERTRRCVEVTLRSSPDRAALERAAAPLVARLTPEGVEPAADAAKELSVESELVLVTDPATLLPRRLVWTKAVRLGGGESGPAGAEQTDRSEYDYRWLPPEPPAKARIERPVAPPPANEGAAARALSVEARAR